VSRKLLDVTGERLAAAGLDVQVLSLNSPGIQAESDPTVAVANAAAVNDLMAETIRDHPSRFAGFPALPTQGPKAAARELERAVTDLGLKGALVNAHTRAATWTIPTCGCCGTAAGLDVPLYLHPGERVDTADVLSDHAELVGPMWSWGTDTHRTRCG
jgi:2,3-dihydroxybenzoate decarboxylase